METFVPWIYEKPLRVSDVVERKYLPEGTVFRVKDCGPLGVDFTATNESSDMARLMCVRDGYKFHLPSNIECIIVSLPEQKSLKAIETTKSPHDIDHDQPKNMTWLEYLVSGGDLRSMTVLQEMSSGPDPHFSRADMLRAAKAELDRYKKLMDIALGWDKHCPETKNS